MCGLGNWTDEDLKRDWTDEDMHAVIVYLRHTAQIVHSIPRAAEASFSDAAAYEEDYGGADYAAPPK